MELGEAILIALLLLIGQGFVTWYFSYFKKKGEYEAIKEEIEHVTRTTESIKKELSVLSQNEISLATEKRASIIEYYNQLSKMFHYLSIGLKVHTGEPKIAIFYSEVYPPYTLAKAKMNLFIGNNDVWSIADKIHLIFMDMLNSAMAEGDSVKFANSSGEIQAAYHRHQNMILKKQEEYRQNLMELIIILRKILKAELT